MPQACNFIKKEALVQAISCYFCEIFKNTYFKEHLWWLLLLSDKTQNIKKMKTQESKERKFENKSKINRVTCFNIYIVVFTFLSSIVEVSRW